MFLIWHGRYFLIQYYGILICFREKNIPVENLLKRGYIQIVPFKYF